MRTALLLVLLGSVALGCSRQPSAYPVATFSLAMTCQGGFVGPDPDLHLVLHGELDGGVPRTWAGDSTPVRWPPGYVARFEPALVIYDASGTVRGREGEDMAATSPWHGQHLCMNRDESMLFAVYVLPAST